MKKLIPAFPVLLSVWSLVLAPSWAGAAEPGPSKIRILLVAGGHDYEKEPFLEVFKSFPDVTFQHVEHPKAQTLFRPDAAKAYDILVLYDMWQKIDDNGKASFVQLLKDGKGLVVMHHAIANYNDWDQYEEIIGAKYYLEEKTVNGVKKARSLWKHDVTFTVHVADPDHPVTRGIRDFEIHDETYNLFDVHPGVKPLLTTSEATSAKTIAWAKEYEQARVVYLQLGHDHFAFENPNYRRLVHQSVRWTARRD
jgi:uncharacterized protein